jgi:exopolysaccharide production protein ExoZ
LPRLAKVPSLSGDDPIVPRDRLLIIQALRLIAAAAVVLHHAANGGFYVYGPLPAWFNHINIDVNAIVLFFAISGYVITLQVGMSPLRFAAHRVLRIYPAFLGSLIIGTIVLLVSGVVRPSDVAIDWSLLLLPAGHIQFWSLLPYWTLLYEVMFYFLVFLFMWAGPRRFDFCLVGWALVLIVKNMISEGDDVPMTTHWLHIATGPLSLFFIGGAALARLHAGKSWPAAAIAVIVLFPVYWWKWSGTYVSAFVVAYVGVLHLAILLDRKFTMPKLLVRGGDYSYGFYLLHFPFIAAFFHLWPPHWAPLPVAIAISLLIGGGVGVLYGHLEFIAYRKLKRWLDRFFAAPETQPDALHTLQRGDERQGMGAL